MSFSRWVHDPEHPLIAAEKHLRDVDPLLDSGIVRYGSCGLIDRPYTHFHVLIRTIIEQQLSVKAAHSITNKLLLMAVVNEFEPRAIMALSQENMRACGLSNAKVRYIRGIAEAVVSGDLSLESLETEDDKQVLESLMHYPGIGLWTAEVFLMFSLARLDVLPLGDLVLRNAIARYYGLEKDADKLCYLKIAEPWRPYRSVASWYLWAMFEKN
jgi:DNA-3-methyladenine glycosylase II